jgi:chromosome segregation ATPase
MSLGKDIQRAETKIAALEKRIAEDDAVKAELSAKLAELESTKDADVKAAQAELEKVKQESQAALEAEIAKLAEAEKQVESLSKEITDAKAKLANPAFSDASAKGESEPVEAAAPPAEGKQPGLFEQYQAISDPGQRTKFWNNHEKELRAEAQAAFGR